MEEEYTITGLEQVKLLADPLRLRILELFCDKAMTTKQAAGLLGEKPTRLYHHVDALERAGLIRLVETKKNRGTMEKYYRSVASRFRVDHSLFELAGDEGEAKKELLRMLEGPLESAIDEIRRNVRSGKINGREPGHRTILSRTCIRVKKERLEEVHEKVIQWLDDLREEEDCEGEEPFSLTLAFYPAPNNDDDEEEKTHEA